VTITLFSLFQVLQRISLVEKQMSKQRNVSDAKDVQRNQIRPKC